MEARFPDQGAPKLSIRDVVARKTLENDRA